MAYRFIVAACELFVCLMRKKVKIKIRIIISIKMYKTSNKKVRDPKQDNIWGEAHKYVSLAPGISKPIVNQFLQILDHCLAWRIITKYKKIKNNILKETAMNSIIY